MKFKSLIGSLLLVAGIYTNGVGADKPLVVATASVMADMARQIGGDLIDVRTIVPIGGDPHIYEPTPGDATMVTQADMILVNGLTFEGWINELIRNSGTGASVYTLTDGVKPIASEIYQNATDPHAWMDATNGLIYVENIANALTELLPEHAQTWQERKEKYQAELRELDAWIQANINRIPQSRRYLITSHDAFHYYGKRYGIKTEAILGTSTDADAQTSDVIRINKLIRENNIPAVFIETTVNPKLLESLARDNNIGIGGKLYSDSLGDKNSPAATYVEMLRFNTVQIVGALTGESEIVITETNNFNGNNWWLALILGIFLIGGFLILTRAMK